MELGVGIVLGQNSGKNSRTEITLYCFFRLQKVGHFKEVSLLGFDALRGDGSSEEVNFCYTKLTFVHCQFKACSLDAFEGCSQVGNEMVDVIGHNADVAHILSTLVRLDDFIKEFSEETRKCGQRPANA